MSEYTEEQLKWLRDRWKGHEEDLKEIIQSRFTWVKSDMHDPLASLMDTLPPLPKGLKAVEKDLRGAYLRGASLSGACLGGANYTTDEIFNPIG